MHRWEDKGDGLFAADMPQIEFTEEFSKFARLQRTRWSIREFIKELIRQFCDEGKDDKKAKTGKYKFYISDPDIENFDSEPE